VVENLFTTQKVMLPLIWRIDPGKLGEGWDLDGLVWDGMGHKQLRFHTILFSNRVPVHCTQQRHIKRIFEGNHEFSQLPLVPWLLVGWYVGMFAVCMY